MSMSDRRSFGWLGVTVAVAVIASPVAAQGENALDEVGRLVGGAWVGDVTMSDGTVFQGKVIYRWGVNRKVVKSETYFVFNGEARLVAEGITGVHPATGEVMFHDFGAGGEYSAGTMSVDGAVFELKWTEFGGRREVRYRQTLRLEGEDQYVWRIHQEKAGEWLPIMEEAVWERRP
jgi:hypothetical protein